MPNALDISAVPNTSNTSSTKASTMTATPTNEIVPTDTVASMEQETAHRVTFGRIVASEWFKFRTVRTNVIAVAGAAAAAVGLGALFSTLAGTNEGPGQLADNALSLSLGGFQLSQIIIAILGVALVASEYQTGLIRTWFGAAPDRLRVLNAKAIVFGGLVFAVSLIAAVVAFLAGQAVLPAGFEALTLGSDGVMQALLGTAFYVACIGVIGVGLGFLLRSTAAGAGAVVTALMIAPVMVRLLPSSIGDPIGKFLPSNAGSAVQGIESNAELLSMGWGVVVLLGWLVAIVGAAAISLKHRDA
ncbi:MAG: ABC-2 type transport system permease protein [Ilumatobacter sp.]|jgi:ABC-2 type transport system permease protein